MTASGEARARLEAVVHQQLTAVREEALRGADVRARAATEILLAAVRCEDIALARAGASIDRAIAAMDEATAALSRSAVAAGGEQRSATPGPDHPTHPNNPD